MKKYFFCFSLILISVFSFVSSRVYASLQNPIVTGYFVSQDGMNIAKGLDYGDGTQLPSGAIFTSSDGGATWILRTKDFDPTFIVGSKDFKNLIAFSNEAKLVLGGISSIGNYVYVSNDSGVTWKKQTGLGLNSWSGAIISGDGSQFFIVNSNSGSLYVSSDNGNTWNTYAGVSPDLRWIGGIASSFDGKKIVGIAGSKNSDINYIYNSSDGGITWTQRKAANKYDGFFDPITQDNKISAKMFDMENKNVILPVFLSTPIQVQKNTEVNNTRSISEVSKQADVNDSKNIEQSSQLKVQAIEKIHNSFSTKILYVVIIFLILIIIFLLFKKRKKDLN